MDRHVQSAIANANAAAAAVTGSAHALIHVPEIENDPEAARKLAVAVFYLADAVKALSLAVRG